jgi:hypothetical protein
MKELSFELFSLTGVGAASQFNEMFVSEQRETYSKYVWVRGMGYPITNCRPWLSDW